MKTTNVPRYFVFKLKKEVSKLTPNVKHDIIIIGASLSEPHIMSLIIKDGAEYM